MTSLEQPLRYPDIASPSFMTRRAWWLVVVNVLFPGTAQVLAGNRRLGRFGMGATLTAWAILVLAFLLGVLWRPALITIVTFGPVLFLGQVLLVGYAVLWLVLTLDTLRLVRVIKTAPRARAWIAVSATLLMVFFSGTAMRGSLAMAFLAEDHHFLNFSSPSTCASVISRSMAVVALLG